MSKSKNPFAPNPELKIWLGNELVPMEEARISVFDHGLLYGDGVFEGIRVYGGKIFLEKEHIKRFFESAKAIRLEIPMTPEQVSEAMYAAMAANGLPRMDTSAWWLPAARAFWACLSSIPATPRSSLSPTGFPCTSRRCTNGVWRCVFASTCRNHPNSISPRIKSLNYLNNILAKAEAQAAGADEAIMLTTSGTVAECTGDNIFIVRNGEIQTPPASEGILEGLTRNLVMELGAKRGISVVEKILIRHDLYVADECFATGTAAEVIPITEVDGREVGDGKAGPITKQLLKDFIAYRSSH